MKFLAINEYLQTLAALGAIVGLIAVAYEVQQSNRVAMSATAADNWSQWVSTSTALIEADIAAMRAKEMTSPKKLTLEERINLDLYFQIWVFLYSHNLGASYFLGTGALNVTDLEEDASLEAPSVFGSSWSRAWLVENKYWIAPPLFEAIKRGLEGVSVGSDLEYYNRIDALAATIK